jgi:hypothetical protein
VGKMSSDASNLSPKIHSKRVWKMKNTLETSVED